MQSFKSLFTAAFCLLAYPSQAEPLGPPDKYASSSMQIAAVVHLNPVGAFYVKADINDTPAQFIVDTGAAWVSISKELAQRIGLDASKSKNRTAISASGELSISIVNAEMVIGSCRVKGVEVAIIPGLKSAPLLGLSFLKQLRKLEIEGGVLRMYCNTPLSQATKTAYSHPQP